MKTSSRFLLAALVLPLLAAQSLRAQIVITRTFMVNQTVPDFGERASAPVLNVGGATIQHVQVGLTMSSAPSGGPMFNGDYYASLGHGTGFAVLLNRVGKTASNAFGYSDAGFNVTFGDNAAAGNVHTYQTELGGAPAGGVLTGAWAPDGRNVSPGTVTDTTTSTATLASFNGLSADGEWRLLISDESSGGVGVLESWMLRLVVMPPAGTMQLDDAEFAGDTGPQTLTNTLELGGASTVSGAHDLTFQGALAGSGTLTKSGEGRLVLNNPHGFAGALAILDGVVDLPAGLTGSGSGVNIGATGRLDARGAIARSLANQGIVVGPAVGSGQFLTFTGNVSGAGGYEGRIAMNGAFSPGNSPGIVTVTGDLLLDVANVLTMEIGGLTPGTEHDRLDVSGTLTFGGQLAVSLINGYEPLAGQTFDLFNGATIAGTFDSYQLPGLAGGLAWDTTQLSTGQLGVSAIPEPSTVALACGAVVLGYACWRRKRIRAARGGSST